MSEAKDCGRCHLAGVPHVMPSGAIVTDDFCGECPHRPQPERPFSAIEALNEYRRRVLEAHEHQRQEAASGALDRLAWHPRKGKGDE
jgi:hypothetical protein